MIDPPLYQHIVDEAKREARQQDILDLLEDRFGPEARELGGVLKDVAFDQLRELLKFAARCRSLAAFRKRLQSS